MKDGKLKEAIVASANHIEFPLYHSQPQPRGYSVIAASKRSVSPSAIQLAFVNAVVKVK